MNQGNNGSQVQLLKTNVNFLKLWLGCIFAFTAERMFMMIVPVWLFDSTHSTEVVAMGTMTESIAVIIFGFIGGVFIDRSSKRALLIWMNLLAVVLIAPVSLNHASFIQPWIIIALVFMLSALNRMLATTRTVVVNSVVTSTDLGTASNMLGFLFSVSLMIGPILGSFVLGFGGYKFVLNWTAGCFLMFVLLALSMRFDESNITQKRTRSITGEFHDGFRVLKQSNRLWGNVLFMGAFMMAAGIFMSLTYVYMVTVLHAGVSEYSLFISFEGVGSIAGAFVLSLINRRQWAVHKVVSTVMAIMVILEALYLFIHNVPFMLVIAPLIGISQQVSVILAGTVFQKQCPKEYLGRVIGFRQTVVSLLSIVSTSVGAGLTLYMSVQNVMFVGCLVLALCVLFGFLYVREEKQTTAMGTEAKALVK